MSYDLMVFEQSSAPRDRNEFLKWYDEQTEWNEDHNYGSPEGCSPALLSWYSEMKKQFPPMNGPDAITDAEIDSMEKTGTDSYIADYSFGSDVIYVAFAWSVSTRAYEATKALAASCGVGFFDVSSVDGDVIFP